MMSLLEKFIREELTWSYWMRRPRNNQAGDISAEIEQQRADRFGPVAEDFDEIVSTLLHRIEVANTVEALEDALIKHGINAYEVVADGTMLDRAHEEGDVEELKRQILDGVETWAREKLQGAAQGNFDVHSLQTGINDPDSV